MAAGCGQPASAAVIVLDNLEPQCHATPSAERDAHSYAVPSDCARDARRARPHCRLCGARPGGHATLTIEAVPSATTLVLDTRDLVIQGVTDGRVSRSTTSSAPMDHILGRALTGHAAGGSAPRHGVVPDQSEGCRASVAPAGTDRRRQAPVSLLAGRGDPHPHVDPDAGQPRHPPDLRRAHRRTRAADAR